jgi:hypothetical protein
MLTLEPPFSKAQAKATKISAAVRFVAAAE